MRWAASGRALLAVLACALLHSGRAADMAACQQLLSQVYSCHLANATASGDGWTFGTGTSGCCAYAVDLPAVCGGDGSAFGYLAHWHEMPNGFNQQLWTMGGVVQRYMRACSYRTTGTCGSCVLSGAGSFAAESRTQLVRLIDACLGVTSLRDLALLRPSWVLRPVCTFSCHLCDHAHPVPVFLRCLI